MSRYCNPLQDVNNIISVALDISQILVDVDILLSKKKPQKLSNNRTLLYSSGKSTSRHNLPYHLHKILKKKTFQSFLH